MKDDDDDRPNDDFMLMTMTTTTITTISMVKYMVQFRKSSDNCCFKGLIVSAFKEG